MNKKKNPKFIIDQDESCNISTSDGKSVAECFNEDFAQLIVQRLNYHDEVVEFLEQVLHQLNFGNSKNQGLRRKVADLIKRAEGP